MSMRRTYVRMACVGSERTAACLASSSPPAARPSSPPSDRPSSFPLESQRVYGFSAEALGITDAQAAEVATAFSAYDADDNGLLSLDEFQRLW